MFISCVLFCCTWVKTYDDNWSQIDKLNLERAQRRCKELYDGRSPCLTKFTKTEPQVYRAICGKENNN